MIKPGHVHHLLIIDDKKTRRTIYLDQSNYTIGRHSSNSIVVLSKKVSRFHATIIRRQQTESQKPVYCILDGDLSGNKSNNGVFINDKRCLVHQLENGDVIRFGDDVTASYHVIGLTQGNQAPSTITPVNQSKREQDVEGGTWVSPEQIGAQIGKLEGNNRSYKLFDTLTNLPTYQFFEYHLSRAIIEARRNTNQLVVVSLEIEKFEQLEQSLGEILIRKLLEETGKRLSSCFRASDILCYCKNGQFMLLLDYLNNTYQTNTIAERILRNIKPAFELGEDKIQINVNIGLALYPQDGQDKDTLIRRATVALCRAKRKESNRYEFYDEQMNAKTEKMVKMRKLFVQGLSENQFLLHYQPLVNIRTGEIYGLEAFLRWQHPKFGMILPRQFINLLEEPQMIMAMSQWVLTSACTQAKNWHDLGSLSLPVAVNLSGQEFFHPSLVKMVATILEKTGLDPRLLDLEIPESIIVGNLVRARKILNALNGLSVRLSIDNFGVGRACIADLKGLPIRTVKIAQSLVSQLTINPQDIMLISAAISVAQSFDYRVVIQGVETQEQLEMLCNFNCEQMQGYRFVRPMNAQQTSSYLSQQTYSLSGSPYERN